MTGNEKRIDLETWVRIGGPTLRRGHADMGVVRVVVAHRSSVCSEAELRFGTGISEVVCAIGRSKKNRGEGCLG